MGISGYSKRSRALGAVTPNACTECRKKRRKCDGQRPCEKCVAREVECIYETPTRQSKGELRAEIEQLRKRQQQSERILAALASDDRAENVLDQLRSHETLQTISKSLDLGKGQDSASSNQAMGSILMPAQSNGDSPFSATTVTEYGESLPPQFMQVPGSRASSSKEARIAIRHENMMRGRAESSPASQPRQNCPLIRPGHEQTGSHQIPDSTIKCARGQGLGYILGPEFGLEAQLKNRPRASVTWTEVTSDTELIEHLIALYFCWEYPTFASLSKEHFLEDFLTGTRRYCSSLLVNSILAVGCRFSTLPSARVDPNDSKTAGSHFSVEALKLLEREGDHHKLTTIQALGLMSIREASCGRPSESIYYAGQSVRIAVEMGLHLEAEGGAHGSSEQSVKSATFWGAFSLDQAWSASIGRLPQFSKQGILRTKPAVVEDIEKRSWLPYTDNGVPLENDLIQPSNVHSVFMTFCELSEILHKSLYVLYTPGKKCTSKSLVEIYTIYLRWYADIPDVLRLGQNSTPSVLFVHMYYHFAILHLFRPFIRLSIVGSSISPRDICNQAADAISALVGSYSNLYTLKRTPSFVPYFVLTSSITHLVSLGTGHGDSGKVRQGFSDLKDMEDCHNFAKRGREILIFLVDHWQVDIRLEDRPSLSAEQMNSDLKTLTRPRNSSMNLFASNVRSVDAVTGTGYIMETDQNLLFCSFPLQGKPLLGARELLQKAGFEINGCEASGSDIGIWNDGVAIWERVLTVY